MNDIIIKAGRIKKELRWLLVSFVISVLFNIYAILRFHTAWKELFTHIHVILILTVIIYVLILLIRLLAGLILRIVTGSKS